MRRRMPHITPERDLPGALQLYVNVIASHPDEQEADFSRAQVQNIVNAVVPKQELFDAQVNLAAAHFAHEGSHLVSVRPFGKEGEGVMLAIGLVETKGLIGLVAATDAMAKAANVQVVKRIGIGGGLVTVIVSGDVGSVRAAVEAGARVAGQVGELVSSHVIANPAEGVLEAFLAEHTPSPRARKQSHEEARSNDGGAGRPGESACSRSSGPAIRPRR
jgi:ethanolamine utilization protein EutM